MYIVGIIGLPYIMFFFPEIFKKHVNKFYSFGKIKLENSPRFEVFFV